MIRSIVLLTAITACTSDYKVTADAENEAGLADLPEIDTADEEIEDDEDDEGETGSPPGTPDLPPADAPTAVCSVTPDKVRPIIESASWIGSESTDPAGLALTYDWNLVDRPIGSAAAMPSGSGADRHGFGTDLAGDYVAELVVTNSEGISSAPCEAVLQAEPVEAMWVEMFWESPGDDMDLHLLAPGGTLETSTDCYYANCTTTWGSGLDWGIIGEASDNPALDLDDIPNSGPENINIEVPENAIYTVVVHDYPGSVFSAGNAVTINIYLDGSLEWSDTRVISGEDSYTYFASIDAATSTVTSL
jgi:hypothetical protein